jgi:hypothetical protein
MMKSVQSKLMVFINYQYSIVEKDDLILTIQL